MLHSLLDHYYVTIAMPLSVTCNTLFKQLTEIIAVFVSPYKYQPLELKYSSFNMGTGMMKRSTFVIIFLVAIAESKSSTRLIHELLDNYDNRVPHDDYITVEHGVNILQKNLCPHQQQLEVKGWVTMMWQDLRLKWNSTEWGIREIWVPYQELYIPDIALYNGVGPVTFHHPDKTNFAVVEPDGNIIWVYAVTFITACNINNDNYPTHQQVKFS